MSVLDSLPGRITGTIMAIIALLILLQQVDLVAGHLNGLYIQLAKPAGYCVLAGEPFDRVLISDNGTGTAGNIVNNNIAGVKVVGDTMGTISDMNNKGVAWPLVISGRIPADFSATILAQWVYVKRKAPTDPTCVYDTNTAGSYAVRDITGRWSGGSGNMTIVSAGYTPQKNSVGAGTIFETDVDAVVWDGLAKKPSKSNNTSVVQTDGWVTRSSFLSNYYSISTLLANLFGLGIPIGLMLMMGSIGAIFVDRLVQGNTDAIDGRIGQIVVIIAMVIIATTVFGLITGGIQLAFNSIDPARFAMYDNVMGRVAATAVGFWGILLVAGLLPIAFSLFRGRQNFLS